MMAALETTKTKPPGEKKERMSVGSPKRRRQCRTKTGDAFIEHGRRNETENCVIIIKPGSKVYAAVM
jgi:hypothetical protein